jgi:hypothetical protein
MPTRGRLDKQIFWKEAHLDVVKKWFRLIRIVPECERHLWTDDTETVTVPDHYKISDINQWQVDNYWDVDPFHVLVDDDTFMWRREEPTSSSLRKLTPDDAVNLFARMEVAMQEGYVHGATGTRFMNYSQPLVSYNKWSVMPHFFDASILHKEGFDFRDLVTFQDAHMVLSLLELGYMNIVLNEYCSEQISNAPGGCALYRTHQLHKENAEKFVELHPGVSSLKTKKFHTHKDMVLEGEYVAVRVSWRKAFGIRANERKAI